MFKNIRSRINLGKDWYNTYHKQIKLITNIPLANKQLAQELQSECKKRKGVLTYEEYLTLEQFGEYGFYRAQKLHGATDIDKRWGLALARYCLENRQDTIIEVGCGTGELGAETIKTHKKITNNKLRWIGVEIDESIHKKILQTFKKNSVDDAVEAIVATIDEIPPQQNALIVFPYSLDNIPPHVFLNTQKESSYPDSLLGVTVQNGILSEVLIPQNLLREKGILFKNGFFTQNGFTFKLTGWNLRKGQRGYISTNMFATLFQFAKKYEDSTIIIIDEFSNEMLTLNLGNVGTPKSLYEKNLVRNELTRYYRESGKHNLYYPLYKNSLFKFLTLIGFRSIEYDIEQKKAAELRGKPWFTISKKYSTYAFTAKHFTNKKIKVLPIPSPQKKLYS